MDEKTISAAVDLGGISALAAAARTILSEDERNLTGFLTRFILGIFSGMMVGFGIHQYGYPPTMEAAIVSASALAAKEILLAIISAADFLRNNVTKILPAVVRIRDKDK